MAEIKRLVAKPVRISALLNGEYVKQEGWEPNYVLTSKNDKISRVNIWGLVISEPTPTEFELDDGSAKITVRQFQPEISWSHLRMGDPIMVIGRPRAVDRSLFIMPEIVKKLNDPLWLRVRNEQLPIEPEQVVLKTPGASAAGPQSESSQFRENYEKVYALIKQLDDGKGADTEEVLQSCHIQKGEEIIKQLILEGEVFELSPGRLKILQ